MSIGFGVAVAFYLGIYADDIPCALTVTERSVRFDYTARTGRGLVDASEGRSASYSARNRPAQPGWHPGEVLTTLEQKMVAGAQTGEWIDLGKGPFDLTEMQAWEEMRTIRAEVLRHLLITDQWQVDARGVRLRGVRINGFLDLESAAFRCPLLLDSCYADAEAAICMDYATAPRITLTMCQLPGVSGEMLTAAELDLSGSTLTGSLKLTGTQITGLLNLRGAQLVGTDNNGDALVADRMKTSDAFLDEGFTAAGAVRLEGAEITGYLLCTGAQLIGTDSAGNSLFADRMKASYVFLDEGITASGDHVQFTAAGAVRLVGAQITDLLSLTGARLTGSNYDGNALVADRLKASYVFLDEGITASGTKVQFTAAGAVRLEGAEITGQLLCSGAQLAGTDSAGNSLFGEGMNVGGDVRLDKGFAATGTVSLASVHVGGSVFLTPTALAGEGNIAINAAKAQISGTLRWAPDTLVLGQVSLEGASVGQLDDQWSGDRPNGYWPTRGQLRLDGFTYGRFGDDQATVAQRLAWIRSQYAIGSAYVTQPYAQLEKVYRQAGQNRQATTIAVAMRRDLRLYGNLARRTKFYNYLLDKTIKYGYQPWRILAVLAIPYVYVLIFTLIAQHHNDSIVPLPQTSVGISPAPSIAQCMKDYPCFNPYAYAFDTIVPVINIHQSDYWRPNAASPLGFLLLVFSWLGAINGWALALFAGGWAARVLTSLGGPGSGQDSSSPDSANS